MESFRLINDCVSEVGDNKKTYFKYGQNIIYVAENGDCADDRIIREYFIQSGIYDVLKKDMEDIYSLLIEKEYPLKTHLELEKKLLYPFLGGLGQLLLRNFNLRVGKYYPSDISELLRKTISNLEIKDAMYYKQSEFESLILSKLDVIRKSENNNTYLYLNNSKGTIEPSKYCNRKLYPNISSRDLGVWGEQQTINYLKQNKSNSEIIWVSKDYGDGYGFDILCVENGKEYSYEVKALNNHMNPILSIDECEFMIGSHKVEDSYLIAWKYMENPIPIIYRYDKEEKMFITNMNTMYLPYVIKDKNKNINITLIPYTNKEQKDYCNKKVLTLFNNKYKK